MARPLHQTPIGSQPSRGDGCRRLSAYQKIMGSLLPSDANRSGSLFVSKKALSCVAGSGEGQRTMQVDDVATSGKPRPFNTDRLPGALSQGLVSCRGTRS